MAEREGVVVRMGDGKVWTRKSPVVEGLPRCLEDSR